MPDLPPRGAGPWPGRFVWFDLMTTDGARAEAFYAALFDWNVTAVPMGPAVYRMIGTMAGPIGGIVEESAIPASHWMPYVAVADVDAAARRVGELGGAVCVPPTDIPGTGRFAVVSEPTGATFSLFAGNDGSHGTDPDVPLPGSVCWTELMSVDPARTQAFLSGLLGWRGQEEDMGTGSPYRLQMLGEKQVAGLMQTPQPGMPSCCLCYLLTLDLAGSTQKARQLGATILMDATPIPGVGRFVLCLDPTGATFALFEPAAPAA